MIVNESRQGRSDDIVGEMIVRLNSGGLESKMMAERRSCWLIAQVFFPFAPHLFCLSVADTLFASSFFYLR
jgi:hypothetical protein